MSSDLLSGLHVLDLSTFVAGPSGTMVLAQLGADVVRIDPPGGAADTRRLPLAPDGSSLYWAGLNRHKRSVCLDLRREEGRAVVRRLLARPGDGFGILVTNAVDQRWLDYDELCRARADLIMVHIGGRPDGRPAVDYTCNAEVGLPWLTGPVDSTRPVNHVLPAWDLLTGMHAALSVVAADRRRRATGEGALIRINLSDVAVTTLAHLGFLADTVINGSTRSREGNSLYGAYGNDFATADGHRIMVVALTDRHWRRLVEVTEASAVISALEEWLGVEFTREEHRYTHRELITTVIGPWFAARTRSEVVDRLDRAHVLWGAYRRIGDLDAGPDSPVAASGLFEPVDHPGVGTYPVPGPVARVRGLSPVRPAPAATLGEHTDEVLAEWHGDAR